MRLLGEHEAHSLYVPKHEGRGFFKKVVAIMIGMKLYEGTFSDDGQSIFIMRVHSFAPSDICWVLPLEGESIRWWDVLIHDLTHEELRWIRADICEASEGAAAQITLIQRFERMMRRRQVAFSTPYIRDTEILVAFPPETIQANA